MRPLPVTIDSRLRIELAPEVPKQMVEDLKALFTHNNPDFFKKQKMGFSTHGVVRSVETWSLETGPGGRPILSLPRGGTSRLRDVAMRYSFRPVFRDRRTVLPEVEWPSLKGIELRYYQEEAKKLVIETQQGLVRAPTGGGKTVLALAAAAATRQPALVIMYDGNLLKQWKQEAVEKLGFKEKEIGILKGGRVLRVGKRLTLALQQTLSSKSFPLDELDAQIGAVVVDEVQKVASRTSRDVINFLSAKYRIGVSADETRKDQMEFITYDVFGEVLYTITREQLEADGFVVPVVVRLVPTDFRADWYRDASSGEKDFGKLLESMMLDSDRERVLMDLIQRVVSTRETPLFIFSQRTEHAKRIADTNLYEARIRCGLMIGGDDNATRFAEDKRRLLSGDLPVAAGTFQALGVGLNVPGVRAGIMALPIGQNPQFFNQVRGRVCRASKGKTHGILYVLWDRHVFPNLPKMVWQWNGGNAELLQEDGSWRSIR